MNYVPVLGGYGQARNGFGCCAQGNRPTPRPWVFGTRRGRAETLGKYPGRSEHAIQRIEIVALEPTEVASDPFDVNQFAQQ